MLAVQGEEEEEEGGGREVEAAEDELLEGDEGDEEEEELPPKISQNESELETDSQMDTSYEEEAKPVPVIKTEPELEAEKPKTQKVEEPTQAPVSDSSPKDVKPEIKQESVAKEENKDQVILPSSYVCSVCTRTVLWNAIRDSFGLSFNNCRITVQSISLYADFPPQQSF